MIDRRYHKAHINNRPKMLEMNKRNIHSLLERKMNESKHIQQFSNKKQEFVLSNHFKESFLLKENSENNVEFIPNFKIETYKHRIFEKLPVNKELRYDVELIKLAMLYGMILQIQYRGADDNFVQGRTRVIYPMCVGTSSKGKPLLRVYHLKGWSYSENNNIEEVWRLFRTDRILSMSFTGMFFRLTPEGYNVKDKGMRGGIIKSVKIEEVRENQKRLVQQGIIQNKKEVTIDEGSKVTIIKVKNTNSDLDLKKPFKNVNIDQKNKEMLRLTFLKSTSGNNRMCVLGVMGKKGNVVKVTDNGKYLGTFRVVKYTRGVMLGKPHLKRVKGNSNYPLYIFDGKK